MRAGDSRVLGGNQPASSIIYMGPAVRLRLSPHLEGTHLASRIPKVTILFLIAGTLALPAWSAELVMVNSRACFYAPGSNGKWAGLTMRVKPGRLHRCEKWTG